MKQFLPSYTELLKRFVQEKAGLKILTPADCKRIAYDIKKETDKQVSETTLKRFFGFASQKFNFSRFTVAALCEYVGFKSWEEFCKAVDADEEITITSTTWAQLKRQADAVSRITLKSLQNRSGIPYEYTVSREFAEMDFEYFINSRYKMTGLIAPPGSGKSIMLTHLMEKFFLSCGSRYSNCVVWFINGNVLSQLNATGFNFESWLNEQTGFSGLNFRKYFQEHPHELNGKIFLVLDGIDEYLHNNDQVHQLFTKITDLVCANEENDWMKVVVALRSSAWQGLAEWINNSEYLKKYWYPGVYFEHGSSSNIAPLSNSELTRVISQIRKKPVELKSLHPHLLSQLRHPFYLQVYYQVQEKNKALSLGKLSTSFELVSEFIVRKIYLSRYSTEKLYLIRKFMDWAQQVKTCSIEKKWMIGEINLYHHAYDELINSGVFVEDNRSAALNHKKEIRFIHPDIFDYFLAQQLIENNNNTVNRQLVQRVEREIRSSSVRITILQWLACHTIKNKGENDLSEILRFGLAPAEKMHLSVFICDLIRNELQRKETGFRPQFPQTGFISGIADPDFISPNYESALETLVQVDSTEEEKVILSYMQAVIALVELNKEKLKGHILELKRISRQASRNYPIDLTKCLEFLYMFFCENSTNYSLTDSIHLFVQSPPEVLSGKPVGTLLNISYRLALTIYSLTRPPEEVLELIEVIRNLHPKILNYKYCPGLRLFILIHAAYAYLALKQFDKAIRIGHHVLKLYEYKKPSYFTPFSQMMMLSLLGQVRFAEGDAEESLAYHKKAYHLSEETGLILPLLYVASKLLGIYKKRNDFEQISAILKYLNENIRPLGHDFEFFFLEKISSME